MIEPSLRERRYYYSLYGLVIDSAVPLPTIIEIPKTIGNFLPDVTLEIDTDARDPVELIKAPSTTGSLTSRHSISQHKLYFSFSSPNGETIFALDSSGKTVKLLQATPALLQNELTLFLHPIMAYVSALQGRLALHANLVKVNDVAIAILGPSGSGKSTLTAGFLRRRYQLFADDLAVIRPGENECHVLRGLCHLKICKTTAQQLGFSDLEMAPVFEELFLKKYPKVLVKGTRKVEDLSLPLRAVYSLQPRRANSLKTRISDTKRLEALSLLGRNTSGLKILPTTQKKNQLRRLFELVQQVPVMKIECPDNLKSLDSACSFLLQDFLSRNAGQS